MKNSDNRLIIGIAGVGRSGKDTLALALNRVLRSNDTWANPLKFSIAGELKLQLQNFILEQFGIDILSDECEESDKELVRGLMVEWGLIHRKRTEGRYLIELLQKDIEEEYKIFDAGTTKLIPIITDIRYDEYENDEVDWLQKELGGKLIHVKRKLGESEMGEPIFYPPKNDQEALNDPKLQEKADYHIEWEDKRGEYADDFFDRVAIEALVNLKIISP